MVRHSASELGYTVDVARLLFSRKGTKRKRNFLVKNDAQKVKAIDMWRKTIVLIISPVGEHPDDHYRNLVVAYEQLMPVGGVEFVFVPLYPTNNVSPDPHSASIESESQKAIYKKILNTMPWPAIPFHDVEECGGHVAKTFSIDTTPYWVIIDPTSKVVATPSMYPHLFKPFRRLCTLCGHHCQSRKQKHIINKWDQLLASPTRNFLLSSNGDKVPISSLQGKVIGLYFCENIPDPPSMELVKKVYLEAKLRGYDFEIVQINFHYQFFNAIYTESADLDAELHYENINWLRLPFKDPSCRNLQKMFDCHSDEDNNNWRGDCLCIIDLRQADKDGVLFELSGAEIFAEYGIEGYPFTRQSLFETERKRQKEELTLQSVFPQHCRFMRGDGCYAVNDSQLLTGKRVLVLLGGCESQCRHLLGESMCEILSGECKSHKFVSMLKSKYCEQLNDEAVENKFEVVFVSTDFHGSFFNQYVKDMPWLVVPFSLEFGLWCDKKIFKYGGTDIRAAAFDTDGRLIAKERRLCFGWGENETDKFPFVSQDWELRIMDEVGAICALDQHVSQD